MRKNGDFTLAYTVAAVVQSSSDLGLQFCVASTTLAAGRKSSPFL